MNGIVDVLLETGSYNLIPFDPKYFNVCHLFGGAICASAFEYGDMDPTIDKTSRKDMYLTNFPSGAGYGNFIHYG